jgi:hypothetical protein
MGTSRFEKGRFSAGIVSARFPEAVALWSCVVTFRSLAQPTTVAVTGSTEVVWAMPLRLETFVLE